MLGRADMTPQPRTTDTTTSGLPDVKPVADTSPWRRRRTGDLAEQARADNELIRRCHASGSPEALRQTVEQFMPLARGLARRYGRGPEPAEDLEQVAAMGLVRAIQRFDPGRGTPFVSFAVPTITGEIRRHFRDHGWAIHVPRRMKELAAAVDRQTDILTEHLGRTPTVAEVARALDVSDEDVLDARMAGHAMWTDSLNRTSDSDDDEFRGRLAHTDYRLERTVDRVTARRLIDELTPQEQQLLTLRFRENMTQAQIGAHLGVSQMQVSRLLRRTLNKLQANADAL